MSTLSLLFMTSSLLMTSSGDTCQHLRVYLENATVTTRERLARDAVRAHRSNLVSQRNLEYCKAAGTGCCTRLSEQVLRRTASDSFLTITYYMILEKTQEALLRLLHQIKQEIPQVVAVADGPDTADLMRRYLIEGDVSVTLEHVTDAKLVNFVSRMWSHTWAGHCFNSLNRTRTETAIRVYTTMSQYKHMIRGIETAVEFIPKLRKYAKEHFSEHCKDALVKAGLFEGAGCQMCAPGIAGAPVCSEYCLNVAKGCMRPILCYLTQWKEWIRHQQSITRELLTVSGERRKFLGTLMTTFETEMLEHAPQYRIYGECTPPETPTKGEQAVKYKVASLVPPVLLHSRDLFIRRFSDLLTSLPQQFCEEMMGKQPVTENCWNGLDTSGYQKPPSLFNMEDQKCNPEVLPERLPCDLATAGKNLECDRGSYLMTGYAATPSVEPPGRAGSGGLVGHPTQFYVCLFVSLFLLSR